MCWLIVRGGVIGIRYVLFCCGVCGGEGEGRGGRGRGEEKGGGEKRGEGGGERGGGVKGAKGDGESEREEEKMLTSGKANGLSERSRLRPRHAPERQVRLPRHAGRRAAHAGPRRRLYHQHRFRRRVAASARVGVV